MHDSRRDFLRNASAFSALAVGASATATAADCGGVPDYDAATLYESGDRTVHDGVLWEAVYATRANAPSEGNTYWSKVGPCDGSGGSNAAPTAAVSASVTTVTTGETVDFDASGSTDADGSIAAYSWDFTGDGTADASGQTTSHSYATTGDYTAVLTVTDDDGATATDSVRITVEPSNEAPTASFTTGMSTPAPGEDVTFDASGSSDPDSSIASYAWNFGDGATANGQSVTHSYDSAGDYTVTLSVTDDDDASATASTMVSVSSGNAVPDASFTVSPSTPEPGESATLDAAESADPDGSITSYEWAFGDGTTATGESVTHTYEQTGEYTVTLTVTDDAGATDSNSTTVTVGNDSGGGATGDTEFAPYNYVFTDPDTTMVDHADQAGNEAFTAAFVLSDGNGNAAWGGDLDQLVGEAGLQTEFQAYQDQGGTIIVSFGGAVGTMIAQDTTDIEKIKSEYQSVIDTYGVTHLDFDIESVDEAAVDRRNQALAELQSENPDLKVSYTLRCRTTGLTSHGTYVVESARDNGVDLQYVNVMTMNYGWVRPSASTVKDTANGTYDDLTSIFPDLSADEAWSMVGLTPMLGENNVGGEHRISDAEAVVNFVQDKGVGLVSFWSIDRDNGDCPDGTVSGSCSGIAQEPYEFSNVYNEVQ